MVRDTEKSFVKLSATEARTIYAHIPRKQQQPLNFFLRDKFHLPRNLTLLRSDGFNPLDVGSLFGSTRTTLRRGVVYLGGKLPEPNDVSFLLCPNLKI